ncbi:MAG: FecR domain-containing protein [Chromatiales bacterium]|nr:FecR domain-containing protein [Gammaproteobacteria bacterium]MCP5353027.1 FecR domain-containing protein [Chromatiales bacterium]
MNNGHPASSTLPVRRTRWLMGLFVLCGLLFASLVMAAEPIGKLIVAAGKIEARAADGSIRPLRRQAEIFNGDTLITGGNVFAQIRFKDGALVALRPDTEFTIEDYRFDGAEDGTERAIFKLIKGGFRTITGAIGHKNKENYQVSTPVATIGIRGTHYGVRQVTPELAAESQRQGGENLRPGLYGGVVDGEIAVGNAGGEQTFGNDRYFFVANAQTPPESLIEPPGVVFDEDQPTGEEEQTEEGGDGPPAAEGEQTEEQAAEEQAAEETGGETTGGEAQQDTAASEAGEGDAAATGTNGDGIAADGGGAGTGTDAGGDTGTGAGSDTGADAPLTFPSTLTPTGSLDSVLTLTTSDTSGSTTSVFASNQALSDKEVIASSFTRAPNGAGTVIGFIDNDGSKWELITAILRDNGTDAHSIYFDTGTSGNVRVKQATTQGKNESNVVQTHTFSFGTASLVEGGLHSASGASWGRWSGDFTVTTDGVNNDPITDLHYVYAGSQASQSAISGASSRAEPIVIYDRIDAASTTPTDVNGNTGSYEYFIIGVNFATQKLVGYEIKAKFGNAIYTVELKNDLDLSEVLGDRSAELTGTCTGCGGNAASVTLTGDGSIMFIDDALTYLGAGFAVRDSNSQHGFTGAAILQSKSTRTVEVNAAANAVAHLAFVTSDSAGYKREVHGLRQDGTNDQIKIATVNTIGNVVVEATENLNAATNRTVFESTRADLTDTGGNSVGVNWGRWQDGWNAQISGVGTGSAGHAHFIYSDKRSTSTPALSLATFNRIAGTSPTDEKGNVANSVSASMNVDLLGMTVTAFNLNVGFTNTTGRSWSLSKSAATSTIALSSVPMAQVALTGTCTGCATSTVVGNATVDLIGTNAEYAISGFGASTGSNAEQVVGTMLMQR